MSDFTVRRYGTDTSGRPIFMTQFMRGVWQQILGDLRVARFAQRLVIVQGAFMARAGGGAADSEGYHDEAGCIDVRTWNLSPGELDTFIRVAREHGWAFWRRDRAHGGMDPHAHGVLGTDRPLAPGAARQWQQYLAGQNGLADHGRDYEWRPSPLVTTPPIDWSDMATKEEIKAAFREVLNEASIDTPENDAKYAAARPKASILQAIRRTWAVSRASNLHTAEIDKQLDER